MTHYSIPQPDANDPQWRTADRVLITDGLRVWDYDREPGSVDLQESFGSYFEPGVSYWDGWFKVKRDKGGHSLMNGERMTTHDYRHGAPPPAPLPPGFVRIDISEVQPHDSIDIGNHECTPPVKAIRPVDVRYGGAESVGVGYRVYYVDGSDDLWGAPQEVTVQRREVDEHPAHDGHPPTWPGYIDDRH